MIARKAYAKINLGLRILGKREDGFHEIETVFYRINLYDDLTFAPSSDISFTSDNPHLPLDDENLCVRAARLLQTFCGISEGAKIHLAKRIPVGAGLGGGSSDAATTLLALQELWKTGLRFEELHSLAMQLGSDVPYFLREGSAVGKGRGEVLEYFPLDLPYWIVLVTPPLHVSTAWAYSNVASRNSQVEITLREVVSNYILDPVELQRLLKNDFETNVFRMYKQILEIKESLYQTGAVFAQLSGSGSSVYGFYSGEQEARSAAALLRKQRSVILTPPHFFPTV